MTDHLVGSWAAGVILRATVLLSVAGLVCGMARRASASFRHLVWASALMGSVAVPGVQMMMPAWRVPVLPAVPAVVGAVPVVAVVEAERRIEPEVGRVVARPEVASEVVVRPPVEGPAKVRETPWLAVVWAVGALAVMVPVGVGHLRLARLRSRSSMQMEGPAAEMVGELARGMRLGRPVELRETDEAVSPMTWGTRRPVVLLPASARHWPADRLRAVLLHELAHVQRSDPMTQLLGRVACAFYWFHPLAWLADRRMREERERACDDLVLRSGSSAVDYASHLLAVARSLRATPWPAMAAEPMARSPRIEGRLRAILDGSRSRRPIGRRAGWLAMAVAALMVVPVSTARLVARASDVGQAATMTVSGRVLDPEGHPVAGARVAIVGRRKLPLLNARADDQHQTMGTTLTDAEGQYRLDVSRTSSVSHYEVQAVAASPGFGLAWAQLNRDAEAPTADVRLRPEQVVEARLVDSQGAPATSVEVRISSIGVPLEEVGGYDGLNLWQATPAGLDGLWPPPAKTDAEGRVRFGGIGRGVRVGSRVNDPRYADQSMTLATVDAGDAKREAHTLRPAMPVAGTVTCADTGEPIRDAIVVVGSGSDIFSAGGNDYRTDAEGRFSAHPAPGKYLHVTVYPPAGSPYLIFERNFELGGEAEGRVVDLAVPRGVLMTGLLTERGDGRPLAGGSVCYENGQGNVVEREGTIPGYMSAVPTAADGRYAIAVTPGKGTLVFYGPTGDFVHQVSSDLEMNGGKPGGRRLYAHAFVPYEVKADEGPKSMDVELDRGATVSGRVVGPDGKPVERAEIVTTLSISPFHTFWRGDFTIPVRDGRFELHGVPRDRSVKCSFLDAEHGWGKTIEVTAADADRPLNVTLEPGGTATARMVDTKGRPFEGGVVSLNIVATPGPGTDFGGESLTKEEHAEIAADEEIYANVDRRNYWESPKTDLDGRVRLTKLIPGAVYRVYEYAPDRGPEASRWRDFTVEAGETADLGEIRVKR